MAANRIARVSPAPLMACLAVAGLLAACGPSTGSGAAPTATVPFPTAPTNANPGQLPGSNPACQQANAPIQGIGQVETDLRSGQATDAAAETNVLAIQQVLVTIQQTVGEQTQIGKAIQNVVFQLGEVGTALNQNATISQLNPLLANVDAAVTALATACASG